GVHPEIGTVNPCSGADWQLWDTEGFTGGSLCFSGGGSANLPEYDDPVCIATNGIVRCLRGLRNWDSRVRSFAGSSTEAARFNGLTSSRTLCQTPTYAPFCFRFQSFCTGVLESRIDPTAIGPDGRGDGCAYYAYDFTILN